MLQNRTIHTNSKRYSLWIVRFCNIGKPGACRPSC